MVSRRSHKPELCVFDSHLLNYIKRIEMLVDKLRKYLKETPHEQLVKEWNEIADMDFPGPTVADMLKHWDKIYK